MNILITDNNPLWRIGIREALEHAVEGISIVGEAANGREALLKAGETNPDVILMDIDMPVCDGIEVTRQLGIIYPNISVLILTNEYSSLSVRGAFEAGAKGYMLKNTTLNELIAAIRAVYEGNSYFHPSIAKMVLEDMFHSAKNNRARSKCQEQLSVREVEVLICIAEGMGNQAIANKLFISVKTVQTHRRNIMERLDIHNSVDLVKYALRQGLINLYESELEPYGYNQNTISVDKGIFP